MNYPHKTSEARGAEEQRRKDAELSRAKLFCQNEQEASDRTPERPDVVQWQKERNEFFLSSTLEVVTEYAAWRDKKDAEGQEVVYLRHADYEGWCFCAKDEYETVEKDEDKHILYARSANVAALEKRIAELQAENITMKTRVINAAENLLSIETPCMEGDNFAVTICSHFEDCEGETCDNGWHEGATKAYEEIKDAILRHFRAALTREGGV